MHHGIILFALDRRARPFWLAPIRTFHVLPPLRKVAAADQCGRLDEKHGPWHKQVLGHAGMCLWIETALGQRHISRCLNKFRKLSVVDLGSVDPEAVPLYEVRVLSLRSLIV